MYITIAHLLEYVTQEVGPQLLVYTRLQITCTIAWQLCECVVYWPLQLCPY